MPAAAIIPARFASARFPGKPLASIRGKPMVQHVYERARAASRIHEVWVATEDERVAAAVRGFGGNVLITSADHPSGTHRVIEASKHVEGDPVINLQGDEPLILPEQIDQVVCALEEDPDADIATLRVATRDPEEIASPHCVKVVVDNRDYALYFSRAPIPYDREAWSRKPPGGRLPCFQRPAWIHVGLYGYWRRTLQRISSLPESPWEGVEQLEQLGFLYWGLRIRVPETAHRTLGVDLPEDIALVETAIEEADRRGGSPWQKEIP